MKTAETIQAGDRVQLMVGGNFLRPLYWASVEHVSGNIAGLLIDDDGYGLHVDERQIEVAWEPEGGWWADRTGARMKLAG